MPKTMKQIAFATKYDISKSALSNRISSGLLDTVMEYQGNRKVKVIDLEGENTKKMIVKLSVNPPKKRAPKTKDLLTKFKNKESNSSMTRDKALSFEEDLVNLKKEKEELTVRKLRIECDEKEGKLISRDYVKSVVFSYLEHLMTNILDMPSNVELEYRTAIDDKKASGVLKKILTTPIEDALDDANNYIKRKL